MSTNLHAGPVTATFDNGSLRYIRYNRKEIIRGIGFYLRDANWGTLPVQVEDFSHIETDRGFEVSFKAINREDGINFHWKCFIRGTPDQIEFEIKGKSRSSFKRNRLGFVVLHPAGLAGSSLEVTHPNGKKSSGSFPQPISPHQPFKDIRSMNYDVDGLKINVHFDGDIFEMEDQRNWLDASYKTYCTPLDRPFPVQVNQGDEVRQRISLSFSGKLSLADKHRGNRLTVEREVFQLPRIGLMANELNLDLATTQSLKFLKLSHLRVEARTFQSDWLQNLEKQYSQANALDLPVELMIYSRGNELERHLTRIAKLSDAEVSRINWVMCFDLIEPSNSQAYTEKAVQLVKKYLGSKVMIGSGTDYYFTELNRFRPALVSVDFLYFSVQPQVHAFDDHSILETPVVFENIGRSAASFAQNRPIHITPITLKARLNPNATDSGAKIINSNSRIDSRQQSELPALWLLASLKYMAVSGITQITAFQTVGPEGILDSQLKFPVYELLRKLTLLREYEMISLKPSEPLLFDGLVFKKEDQLVYLVLNFGQDQLEVQIYETTFVIGPRSITCLDQDLNTIDL